MRTGSHRRDNLAGDSFTGSRPHFILEKNGGKGAFDEVKNEVFASALSDKVRSLHQNWQPVRPCVCVFRAGPSTGMFRGAMNGRDVAAKQIQKGV